VDLDLQNLPKELPEDFRRMFPSWTEMGYEPFYISVRADAEKMVPVAFRALTKKEFGVLSKIQVPELPALILGPLYTEPYQQILETAMLWPKPLPDNLLAGSDRLIAEAIITASSWISTDSLVKGLEEAREQASSLESFLQSRIHVAFPMIQPQDVDGMTFTRMMRLVGLSEIMTGVQVDLQPFLDPEGYKKRLERESRQSRRQQMEAEMGIRPARDPRMRDPAFRKKLMTMAEESKSRLRAKHGPIDPETMNRRMAL